MTELADSIWYGTSQSDRDKTHEGAVQKVLRWGVLFFFLLILRMLLPSIGTDAMTIHWNIAEAVRLEQNWGRQALVSSWEFPPLTTVAVLCAQQLQQWLPVNGKLLLVAVAQVWSFLYLLRTPEQFSRRLLMLLAGGFLLAVPIIADLVVSLDPNWIAAVPVCSMIYHISRWQKYRSLRDVVLCAVNAALLAFGGIAALAFSCALLLLLTAEFTAQHNVDADEKKGAAVLIWSPILYCVFLLLLLNWLIMGDLLFSIRHLRDIFGSSDSAAVSANWRAAFSPGRAAIVSGGICTLLLLLRTTAAKTAACLLGGLCVMTSVNVLCLGLGVFPAGGLILSILLVSAALLLPWMQHDLRLTTLTYRLTAALFVISMVMGFALKTVPYVETVSFVYPSPSADHITRWIDEKWQDSRIVVCGVRAPAVYADPHELRFLPRVDFYEDQFLERAAEEQLHLLIPPRNGLFYPAEAGPMADIHRNGRPWLLLEKNWPDGWQLWRCVVPPAGESRIPQFKP